MESYRPKFDDFELLAIGACVNSTLVGIGGALASMVLGGLAWKYTAALGLFTSALLGGLASAIGSVLLSWLGHHRVMSWPFMLLLFGLAWAGGWAFSFYMLRPFAWPIYRWFLVAFPFSILMGAYCGPLSFVKDYKLVAYPFSVFVEGYLRPLSQSKDRKFDVVRMGDITVNIALALAAVAKLIAPLRLRGVVVGALSGTLGGVGISSIPAGFGWVEAQNLFGSWFVIPGICGVAGAIGGAASGWRIGGEHNTLVDSE